MKKRLRITGMFLLLLCTVFLCGITGAAAEKKVALNNTSVSIKKDTAIQLKLKGASGKVKWSSSKKSVATVSSSGKVTGKSVGKCVIKAVYRKKTYTCKVAVTKSVADLKVAKNPVKKNSGRILLAGSSSIARWSSAASDFAPYKIVNMAISGTTMEQWSKWYKKAIVAYEPAAVVWYVGGNDLWRRTTPAKTAKMFCDTVKKLHKELPDTQIYFVSVYTNISRKSISKQILTYNKKVKQFCRTNDYITYVDLATKFNNSGVPLKNLLVDGLHPNERGYQIWNDVVAARIKSDLKTKGIKPVTESPASSTGSTEAGSSDLVITGAEIYEDEITSEVSQTVIR